MSRYCDTERLTKILDFLETIDRFKNIYRAVHLSDQSRYENDAEHTWHMAMFALLLSRELAIDVNIEHVLELILTHDLVEIYAGDTFAFDVERSLDKQIRERNAAQQLFTLLPKDVHVLIYGWWQEFELAQTPEALFAKAADRLQAFAQNVFSAGLMWQERGVREEQIRVFNQQVMAFDPALACMVEILYQRVEREHLWQSEGKTR